MTAAERLDRLEDAVVALADFATEGQRQRLTRSLGGAGAGVKVLAFVEAVQGERTAAGRYRNGED
jgi:hypothetical protein